jgi:hypothetical protein
VAIKISEQKDFWNAVLAAEGMPEELPADEESKANAANASVCETLYQAIGETGATPEMFLTAVERNPKGLRRWIRSWAGPMH